MALFKRKEPSKSNVDKALELFHNLSDEELAEFLEKADLEYEDDGEKEDTTEQIEKAEENIEAKGKDMQTEKDRIDESVAEQEKDEGDEDSQDAKDRVDEAEGEDESLEEKDEEKPEQETPTEEELEHEEKKQDTMRAIEARLDEIEERIANIVSKLDGGDFGNHSAQITEQESDGETEDSRIMNSYMRKQAFRR